MKAKILGVISNFLFVAVLIMVGWALAVLFAYLAGLALGVDIISLDALKGWVK